MQCTVDNASKLRDLILQELVKIIVIMLYKRLKIIIQMLNFYTINIKNVKKALRINRLFVFNVLMLFNAYCIKI